MTGVTGVRGSHVERWRYRRPNVVTFKPDKTLIFHPASDVVCCGGRRDAHLRARNAGGVELHLCSDKVVCSRDVKGDVWERHDQTTRLPPAVQLFGDVLCVCIPASSVGARPRSDQLWRCILWGCTTGGGSFGGSIR